MSIPNPLAVSSSQSGPDFDAIHQRRAHLQAIRNSRRYEHHKLRDWRAFIHFLGQYDPPVPLRECDQDHAVDYLIHVDTTGKTVVHVFGCPLWGSRDGSCLCPRRQAWGSVDSLIGRLRAAWFEQGPLRQPNPFAARGVQLHLRDVKYEQLQSRVNPKQATPLFEDKLVQLVQYLNHVLARPLDPVSRFTLLRDRAFLALDLQAWMRGSDLADTLTDGILLFPDGSGWLFGYTWGKTLRTGDRHVFGLRFHTNRLICPLRLVSEYVAYCQTVGLDLRGPGAFLFRPVRAGSVVNVPVAADTINAHLQAYLQAAHLFEGETLHGIRAGGAISAALRGQDLESIMAQAHWASPRMAAHYLRLREVLGQGTHGDPSATGALAAPGQYRAANFLLGFCPVFGTTSPSAPAADGASPDRPPAGHNCSGRPSNGQ